MYQHSHVKLLPTPAPSSITMYSPGSRSISNPNPPVDRVVGVVGDGDDVRDTRDTGAATGGALESQVRDRDADYAMECLWDQRRSSFDASTPSYSVNRYTSSRGRGALSLISPSSRIGRQEVIDEEVDELSTNCSRYGQKKMSKEEVCHESDQVTNSKQLSEALYNDDYREVNNQVDSLKLQSISSKQSFVDRGSEPSRSIDSSASMNGNDEVRSKFSSLISQPRSSSVERSVRFDVDEGYRINRDRSPHTRYDSYLDYREPILNRSGSYLRDGRGPINAVVESIVTPPSRREMDSANQSMHVDPSLMHNSNFQPVRYSRQAMKPCKYDGTTPIDTFLIQFATCADYNQWNTQEKAAHLKCALSGNAGQILWECGDPQLLTYDDLVRTLRARYGTSGQKELFIAQLRARKRGHNESLAELYRDVKRLMALAYPNTSGSDLHEEIAKSHFISALGDRTLELKLREREPKDLDSAFTLAVRLDAYQSASTEDGRDYRGGARGRNPDNLAARVSAIEKNLPKHERPDKQNDASALYAELKKELEVEKCERLRIEKELDKMKMLEERRCASQAERSVNPRSEVETRPKSLVGQKEDTGTRKEDWKNKVKCYRCNQFGHFARECEAVDQRSTNNSNNVTRHIKDSGRSRRPSYLRMRILGKYSDCLLDTGSDVSLLPRSLVGNIPVQPTTQHLTAANGTNIKVIGQVSVAAVIGQHVFRVNGYVTNQVAEVILGVDFLQEHEASWSFSRSEITLLDSVFRLRHRHNPGWIRRIVASEDVVIPGRSECLVPADVVYSGAPTRAVVDDGEWITETAQPVSGLFVSRAIMPERSNELPVRVLNINKDDISLPAGLLLANLEPANDSTSADCSPDNSVELLRSQMIADLVSRIDNDVPDEYRRELTDLLHYYREVISTGDQDLGRCNIVRHGIDTGDAKPIKQPLRRHPPAHDKAIQEHVSTMMEQGVIVPCQSPWASNIVLVRKKDGTLRCCVD